MMENLSITHEYTKADDEAILKLLYQVKLLKKINLDARKMLPAYALADKVVFIYNMKHQLLATSCLIKRSQVECWICNYAVSPNSLQLPLGKILWQETVMSAVREQCKLLSGIIRSYRYRVLERYYQRQGWHKTLNAEVFNPLLLYLHIWQLIGVGLIFYPKQVIREDIYYCLHHNYLISLNPASNTIKCVNQINGTVMYENNIILNNQYIHLKDLCCHLSTGKITIKDLPFCLLSPWWTNLETVDLDLPGHDKWGWAKIKVTSNELHLKQLDKLTEIGTLTITQLPDDKFSFELNSNIFCYVRVIFESSEKPLMVDSMLQIQQLAITSSPGTVVNISLWNNHIWRSNLHLSGNIVAFILNYNA